MALSRLFRNRKSRMRGVVSGTAFWAGLRPQWAAVSEDSVCVEICPELLQADAR